MITNLDITELCFVFVFHCDIEQGTMCIVTQFVEWPVVSPKFVFQIDSKENKLPFNT